VRTLIHSFTTNYGKTKAEECELERVGLTGAGGGGVAALDEEILDDAVEDGVVIIVFEAELHEVPDGFGSLFGP